MARSSFFCFRAKALHIANPCPRSTGAPTFAPSSWTLRFLKADVAMAWRRGFTLVEILVVLIILGVAFTLTIPSLVSPRAPEDAMQRVVDLARRTAIRRAGGVRLSIEAGGAWSLESSSGLDPDLGTGTLLWPHAFPVTIHISALGACMLEAPALQQVVAIDPVRCRLAMGGSSK